jgi:L-seryl-tRNA(Ser) seleniumtransferase
LLLVKFGRRAVTETIREVLSDLREALNVRSVVELDDLSILKRVSQKLDDKSRSSLRTVLNLTGTVLHTNLGRAALPAEAIEAMGVAARTAINLEYDLDLGERSDRDAHVEKQLCRLTGAEAATIVNNNAAAVLLVLNSLALGQDVLTSRGELIEIGGSFRLPAIMARSGCRLREVGTTNRTHLHDYEAAIGPRTALVMKVHTSNYTIIGFTKSVSEGELAPLCHARNIPLVVDLGSGTLIDLRKFGLPHEPTPMEAIKNGADIVTFSGDKLLGGPQAGIVLGRADLIRCIKGNPIKRALRVDKFTIAALFAVLNLYTNPERLVAQLPTLRALTRPVHGIRELATRLQPLLASKLQGVATVEVIDCKSQIGSGALPTCGIGSAGLAMRPLIPSGTALTRLAAAFRALSVPVIGRIQDGLYILDLRCLDDDATLIRQLDTLKVVVESGT